MQYKELPSTVCMRILNHGSWVNVPDVVRLTGKRYYSHWERKVSVMKSAQVNSHVEY
jgi:hypothetical protein